MPEQATRWAKAPFYFNSAAYLIRIERDRANTLGEFADGLRKCADDAIFYHTYQTLQEHHYIQEGFSNDFAHWAFASCNEMGLAERLASVDVREFNSIVDLRERLTGLVDNYLAENPKTRDRVAFEPFYFFASDMVVIPTPYVARNLEEFADGLRKVSLQSLHYHFLSARLRLHLNSNDFSQWLEDDMELPKLADKVDHIDIYTSTLTDVRNKMIRLVEQAAA